jgi:uncharacterized delta-60 repeat protein
LYIQKKQLIGDVGFTPGAKDQIMKPINNLSLTKKLKHLILMLLLLIPAISYSQWISNYYGFRAGDTPLGNAHGTAVTVDDSGYCYVTGYVDENNGQGNNILVIKYNSQNGDTVWTATYNGSANGEDCGNRIKVDADGNVYIVGTVSDSGKAKDVALLKYDSEGHFKWIKTDCGDNAELNDEGMNLAIDALGNIYITGYCNKLDLKSYAVINKYNPEGELKWTNHVNANGINAEGVAIAVNHNGTKVYVAGYVSLSLTGENIMFSCYDGESGNEVFYDEITGGGNASDRAFGIAVDEQDRVIITGYTTTDTVSGEDIVTIMYNPNGTQRWSKIYKGSGNQSDRAFGIVVDETDHIFITGYSTTETGNKDYITICYDQNGNQVWESNPFNGAGNGDDESQAIGIITNSNNTKSVLVTGSSWGLNSNHDYVTIWYDIETGELQYQQTYTMSTNTEDVAKDLAVSPATNDAFITGFSQLLGNSPVNMCAVSTQKVSHFGGSKQLTANYNVPSVFKLMQNYPNPFNPSTTIKFTTSEKAAVKLTVYDVTGREVNVLINQTLNAGTYEINFVTQALSSGVYFYELRAGAYRDVKKMTFVK